MKTGYSVREINDQIALGAQITDSGDIILPLSHPIETVSQPDESSSNNSADSSEEETLSDNENRDFIIPIFTGIALVVIAGVIFVLLYHKRKKPKINKILNENSMDAELEEKSK
jgi:hypothetical protein